MTCLPARDYYLATGKNNLKYIVIILLTILNITVVNPPYIDIFLGGKIYKISLFNPVLCIVQ